VAFFGKGQTTKTVSFLAVSFDTLLPRSKDPQTLLVSSARLKSGSSAITLTSLSN